MHKTPHVHLVLFYDSQPLWDRVHMPRLTSTPTGSPTALKWSLQPLHTTVAIYRGHTINSSHVPVNHFCRHVSMIIIKHHKNAR